VKQHVSQDTNYYLCLNLLTQIPQPRGTLTADERSKHTVAIIVSKTRTQYIAQLNLTAHNTMLKKFGPSENLCGQLFKETRVRIQYIIPTCMSESHSLKLTLKILAPRVL
jgi:hypothetical protein